MRADYGTVWDDAGVMRYWAAGGNYWLVDGFHRYHAARKAGKTTIMAKVSPGTQRSAIRGTDGELAVTSRDVVPIR